MANIMQWDPFRELNVLQNRMNRLFGEFGAMQPSEQSLESTAFSPPVDVYEDQDHVTIKVEAPGIDEKDLDVRIDNNVLTVSGKRTFEKDEKKENYHRIERQYGSFSRSFTLPSTVDPNACKANYNNGVLNISFNKRAESRPRQIQIGAGGMQAKGGEQKPPLKAGEHKAA